MLTAAIAGNAHVVEDSQAGPVMWKMLRKELSAPDWGSKIHCHTMPMATAVAIHGTTKRVRKTPLPGIFWVSSNASSYAKSVCIGMLSMKYSKVTRSGCPKDALLNVVR